MPLPVVVCGGSVEVANSAKGSIAPDYELIHFIASVDEAKTHLPVILQGKTPNDPENVGTKNYSKPPAAVVIGGGYDKTKGLEMREACAGVSNVKWLVPNAEVVAPPMESPEYGRHMTERVKACLAKLVAEGNLEGDGIVRY